MLPKVRIGQEAVLEVPGQRVLRLLPEEDEMRKRIRVRKFGQTAKKQILHHIIKNTNGD